MKSILALLCIISSQFVFAGTPSVDDVTVYGMIIGVILILILFNYFANWLISKWFNKNIEKELNEEESNPLVDIS